VVGSIALLLCSFYARASMKSSLAALSGHRNCTAEGQLTQPHLASIDFLLHKDASSQATKIQKVPQKMDGCND